MHRCLVLDEILTSIAVAIAEQLNDLDVDPSSTLLSLALTCQTFLDPALAQLWQEQETLVPLVKTLPADSWREVNIPDTVDAEQRQVVTITRPLRGEEWSRFDTYASRIKILGRDGYGLFKRRSKNSAAGLSQDAFEVLRSHRPTGSLLPSLQILRWSNVDVDLGALNFAHLYFGPCLTKLDMYFSLAFPTELNFEQVIVMLTSAADALLECPHTVLQEFGLQCYGRPLPGLSSIVSRFLRASRAYHTFSVPKLSIPEDLRYLSSLAALRYMALWPSDVQGILRCKFHPPIVFPALQKLWVGIHSFSDCATLLTHIHAPGLTSLSVSSLTDPTLGCLRRLVSVLKMLPLERVMLKVIFEPGDTGFVFDVHAFSLLFSFVGLREVYIHFPCPFQIDNATLAQAAAAWPLLEKLSLGCMRSCMPGVTFSGLRQLVQRCPRLQVLSLALDVSQMDIPTGSSSPLLPLPECNRQLTRMGVQDSTLDGASTDTVARALFRLFPNLGHIYPSERWSPHWNDVALQVREYGRVLRSA